jgi:hypothetical protein
MTWEWVWFIGIFAVTVLYWMFGFKYVKNMGRKQK